MNPVRFLSYVTRLSTVVISALMLLIAASMTLTPAKAAENQRPVAVKDVKRAVPGRRKTIRVLSNDYDPDGSRIRLMRVEAPGKGTARVNRKGNITYKPRKNARGRDGFRYFIRDRNGKGKRASGKVVVNLRSRSPRLAKLCAAPGVLVCDGFENGPTWDFFNTSSGATDPSITDDAIGVYDGDNAFQLVLDGNGGSDVSGSVAYDIPAQNTVYMHAMIKFEAGLHANLSRFTGSKSPKHFQFVEGKKSCSSDSVNIVNPQSRNVWAVTNGCNGIPYRVRLASGDFNLQPISDTDMREYPDGACTYRHFTSSNPIYESDLRPNPANCVVYEDDIWNRVELRISVGEGVKLWVNGTLVVNMTESDGAGGIDSPRRRLFLTGYMTSHQSRNPANESWRVWYDNLIISKNCITSCGQ